MAAVVWHGMESGVHVSAHARSDAGCKGWAHTWVAVASHRRSRRLAPSSLVVHCTSGRSWSGGSRGGTTWAIAKSVAGVSEPPFLTLLLMVLMGAAGAI